MTYLGSWKIDDLLTFTIVTTRVDTGNATDADSAPSYRVYEDETATPILTGTMATLDAANTAGFYSEQITLSAANGFEKGKSYNIYIQATVNSIVGATTRTLQIEAEVDANVVSGTPPDSTGVGTLLTRLGTPSNLGGGATVAANLADIEGQTDDIGTAGAGLTDLGGMSTTMKGQVQTEAEDALVLHRLDELLNADSDIDGAAPPTVGSVIHEMLTKTAGSFTYDQTTDSQEALRDRGDAAWTTATGFSTHSAADVWAVATRELTAFSSSFKSGYALSSAGVQAIWDALTSALTAAGSIGKLLVDNVNATISSRSSHAAADIWSVGTRTLTGIASGIIAAAARNEIADSIFTRATSAFEASAPLKSLGTAIMKATHRVKDNAGTLEVYRSDGTTVHASQTITTDAAHEPIDELTGAS